MSAEVPGEGTFRWPETELPRLFGQQSGAGAAEPAQSGTGTTAGADAWSWDETGLADPWGVPVGYDDADTFQAGAGDGGVHAPGAGGPAWGAYGAPAWDPAGEYPHPGDGYPPQQRPGVPVPQAGAVPGWGHGETADSLTTDMLLPGRRPPPPAGLPRLVYRASGGLVRLPRSAADKRRQDRMLRAGAPVLAGHHRVAVLSLKGGVGKTTTVMGVGSTLASLRGDRVIALDANPDRGTLSDKLRLETAATVRDLLNERDQIRRYADVRAYTTQAASRLEVLASDRDPAISVAFGAEDYTDVAQVLERYYSICITDCGTGLLHSAMAGVLRMADQIVLVSTPSVDGARSASATLDWLAAHGYGDLVRGGVVALSMVRPRGKRRVDVGRLQQHFAARCRAVVQIPYDPHLAEGAEVDLAELGRPTVDAYLALAAEVGDGFARPPGVPQPAGARLRTDT